MGARNCDGFRRTGETARSCWDRESGEIDGYRSITELALEPGTNACGPDRIESGFGPQLQPGPQPRDGAGCVDAATPGSAYTPGFETVPS